MTTHKCTDQLAFKLFPQTLTHLAIKINLQDIESLMDGQGDVKSL